MLGANPFALPDNLVQMARIAADDLSARGTPAIADFAKAVRPIPEFASEAALLAADFDPPVLDADDNAWLVLASCGYMEAAELLGSEKLEPGSLSPHLILQLIKKSDSCAALGGRSDIRIYPLLRTLVSPLPGGVR